MKAAALRFVRHTLMRLIAACTTRAGFMRLALQSFCRRKCRDKKPLSKKAFYARAAHMTGRIYRSGGRNEVNSEWFSDICGIPWPG